MDPGTLGGIIGTIVGGACGIAGAGFGTYCSIKAARGPRERGFIIRLAVATWVYALLFLAGLWISSNPYRHALWLVYVPVTIAAIRWGNAKCQQIHGEGDPTPPPSRSESQ